MTSRSPDPFAGLRVVDFSTGMAGGLAGMLLADHGALVIKVEPPGGDPFRASPGFLMWNRGKRGVVLDLSSASDRARARQLAVAADVIIETFRPEAASRAGLSYQDLEARNPELVYCSISGFGSATRLEHFPPLEGLVAAKSGRMSGNDEVGGSHFRGRPVFIASPVNSYGAAMLAVQGIVAALLALRSSGRGQHVMTSLLDGASAATMRLAFERHGAQVVPTQSQEGSGALVQRGIRLTFLTAECSDGRYIQMCARQDHHFREWLRVLGLEHLFSEDRFARAPLGLRSMEDAAELESLLRDSMKQKPSTEWMRIFTDEADVGADPFLTFDEFLEHPQMAANGRVVIVEDPTRGPVLQIGPLADMRATPAHIRSSAPQIGEADAEIEQWFSRSSPAVWWPPASQAPVSTAADAAPLSGITIIELAQFIAGPLGTTLLGELGARVIKVEPPQGDSFRRAGLEFVHIICGKESIAIDLKSFDGQEILRKLIVRADALVHNFRPGVIERLGLDYHRVQSVNPKLVYLNASSYGSRGPQRNRPAFHSTPNALSGSGILQAGEANPPVDDSYPDPCAGLAVAAALAIALLARERVGTGQYVETTMLTATAYVHGERLTRYRDAPTLGTVDGQQRGFHALYRLYPCRDGWIFLAATTDREWESLKKELDDDGSLSDTRFIDRGSRASNDAALGQALEALFRKEDAQTWERRMLNASVPLVAVAASLEQFLVDQGLVEPDEHPTFGTYWRLRPRVRFSGSPSRQRAASAIGEHTISILAELGYQSDAIHRLVSSGAVVASRRS